MEKEIILKINGIDYLVSLKGFNPIKAINLKTNQEYSAEEMAKNHRWNWESTPNGIVYYLQNTKGKDAICISKDKILKVLV